MRNLDRNKRALYYAQQTGTADVTDDDGFKTGEKTPVYSKPRRFRLNIGREVGNTSLAQYGTSIPYTRTLVTDDMKCPINEQSVLWIDVPITAPYNYIVTNVSVSLNCLQITAKRVKI